MSKWRLMFVSDAAYPLSNTGFGIVSWALLEGLKQTGQFDIVHVGRGVSTKHLDKRITGLGYRFRLTPLNDPNGYTYLSLACEEEKPHLICFEADPGSIMEWRKNVEVRRVMNLIHSPVEGAPLLSPWSDAMREIATTPGEGLYGRITTYTQFGANTIDRCLDDHLPRAEVLRLGLDHANWRQYDPEQRAKIREHLGWTDKFVVMNVARNAGRKEWPRLLEAVALLKERIPNILLYCHTVPFENYFLSGHNLMALAQEYGITNHIQFMGDIRDPYTGIAFDNNPDGLTLVDMYNSADLFVSPSGGEGWNLPQCEAAACGLPVMTTAYAGGWEVAREFAYPMNPDNFGTHVSGTRFAQLRPEIIAANIEVLYRTPSLREAMTHRGLRETSKFKWEPTAKRFAEIAVSMCQEYDLVMASRG